MRADQPVPGPRAWRMALGEHDAAVAAFIAVAETVPAAQWHLPRAPGKWSPAEEMLHVVLSYETALRGVRTGAKMRLRVSPVRARLLRWFVLPVMLRTRWFPRAKAPVETRPPTEALPARPELGHDTLRARVTRLAGELRDELPRAGPGMRFQHAYFGDLAPRTALRMLSAHTRHHARVLDRSFRKVME